MSDMPERIWAWADQPPFDKDSGGWASQDHGLDAVEYIRADLDVRFGLTLELAAQVAEANAPEECDRDDVSLGASAAAHRIARAIRALAPEPAEVTAARVLLNTPNALGVLVDHQLRHPASASHNVRASKYKNVVSALRAIVGARHD